MSIQITPDLKENISQFEILFSDCADIKKRKIKVGQKKAPDLIMDGCEAPCGCWELNSGPLEEQTMFLTSEPSLHPNLELLISMSRSKVCP